MDAPQAPENSVVVRSKSQDVGDWLWFLVCAVVSSILCLVGARRIGATFDEPVYIQTGLQCWRTLSHTGLIQLGTMPLPIDIQTLPLYLYECISGSRFDLSADPVGTLAWARAGNLVFWWLLLWYGRLIARRLGGAWAGRLAVGLLAFEPNLVAHASLATTDIAISACFLGFAYHYEARSQASWLQRVGVPALWFAALVLSKASGPVFAVLCMLIITWYRRENAPEEDASLAMRARTFFSFLKTRSLWQDIGRIAGWGVLLVFIYTGCDWKPQPDLVRWAHQAPPGVGRVVFTWLAEQARLFPNAGEAILRQISHNGNGQGWFLLGRSGRHYVWYYFPVALTIKLSLPILLLPLLVACARWRCLLNWACVCALTLLLLSVTYHVQIGVRFLFPAVCLAIAGLSAALVCAATQRATGTGPPKTLPFPEWLRVMALPIAGGAAVLWTVLLSIEWWPNGLTYTNGLYGDPRKGYLVSDSNYDWSQGLNELRQWQEEHPNAPLLLWYFGHDPQRRRFKEIMLHDLSLRTGEEVRACLQGHYLAVNTTLIYGGYGISREPYVAYLQSCRPAGRTRTFLIYDFTAPAGSVKSSSLPAYSLAREP